MAQQDDIPLSPRMANFKEGDSPLSHSSHESNSFVREIYLDYSVWQNMAETRLPWYEYNHNSEHRKQMSSIHRIIIPRLWEIISSGLSSRQKDVMMLYFRSQLNQITIAKKLGISQPTVSQHINGKQRNGKKIGGSIKKIKKTIRKMASTRNSNIKDPHLIQLFNQLLDQQTSHREGYEILHSIIKHS